MSEIDTEVQNNEENILPDEAVTLNAFFLPDWTRVMTPDQAEIELLDFTFDGGGWYENDDVLILVIPQNKLSGYL